MASKCAARPQQFQVRSGTITSNPNQAQLIDFLSG